MNKKLHSNGKIVLLILFSVLCLKACYQGKSEAKGVCDKLEAIASDQVKVSYLQAWVNEIESIEDTLKSGVISSGFVDVRKYPNYFSLDWERIGLPVGIASIRINGKGIDYLNLKFAQVDSISLGFGGRAFLVFKYKQSQNWGIQNLNIQEKEKRILSKSIMLVCRK
ncbi:MAG: hypothetical protein HRT37_08390 [Alteromonadaceae bacterium]|nr:hypothetical protein [Alteromonadaceae bacterium]